MFHGRKEITWVWIGMTWELCLVMTPCSVMTPSTWAWCASLGANRNLNTHVQGVQVSITGTNRQEHTSYPTWTANREHGGSSVRETPCFWKGPLKTDLRQLWLVFCSYKCPHDGSDGLQIQNQFRNNQDLKTLLKSNYKRPFYLFISTLIII